VVGAVERFGDRREPPLPNLDRDARIGEDIERPLRGIAGGDEDRPIGLIDVADRDRPRLSRPAAPRREPGDLASEEEVVPDVGGRQRVSAPARCCQDLPSVWVDGA
jgi:hypothetical protein